MLQRIQFYHNTPNPVELACEFVIQAFQKGRKISVYADDAEQAQAFDQRLWRTPATAFFPHVAVNHPLSTQTPIVFAYPGLTPSWPHHDLLFNLSTNTPPHFENFKLFIEIVAKTEKSRTPARQRWLDYKQRGFILQPFDSEKRRAL